MSSLPVISPRIEESGMLHDGKRKAEYAEPRAADSRALSAGTCWLLTPVRQWGPLEGKAVRSAIVVKAQQTPLDEARTLANRATAYLIPNNPLASPPVKARGSGQLRTPDNCGASVSGQGEESHGSCSVLIRVFHRNQSRWEESGREIAWIARSAVARQWPSGLR